MPPRPMPSASLRFGAGTAVMCNMGASGFRLGRVIAVNYREDDWPADRVAPYQVALSGDHSLIYVPQDVPDFVREATDADTLVAGLSERTVAAGGGGGEGAGLLADDSGAAEDRRGVFGYRGGMCHCCGRCPRQWTAAELYSEHYQAAARNGLKITQRAADLGVARVGAEVRHPAPAGSAGGFSQCPTLPRLPPGLSFADDGSLSGTVRFDPHRPASYRVEFVAFSTAAWDDDAVGVVRLEIAFSVEANTPPPGFDAQAFEREQQHAGAAASRMVSDIWGVWESFERQDLEYGEIIRRITAHLHDLRALLEQHPRLDRGKWWAELGGFHMNVHKLMENKLFECELYLGHALMFPDADVRSRAEANLEGCYHKRLLEAARFLWMDGCSQMMRGEWAAAAETLRRAASKKEGWGWGVNNGEIWVAEAAARVVTGAERGGGGEVPEAARLLDAAATRAEGHPWACEIRAALDEYRALPPAGPPAAEWLAAFKQRALFWSAQVLGGGAPFPPQPRPRSEDAAALRRRLPGHNAATL